MPVFVRMVEVMQLSYQICFAPLLADPEGCRQEREVIAGKRNCSGFSESCSFGPLTDV